MWLSTVGQSYVSLTETKELKMEWILLAVGVALVAFAAYKIGDRRGFEVGAKIAVRGMNDIIAKLSPEQWDQLRNIEA